MAKQLKLDVASFLPEAAGNFLFACGQGAWGNTDWKGFGRFDAASGRHVIVACDLQGPLARFADGLVGRSVRASKCLVQVDDDGQELARVELPFELEAACVSPKGDWLLLAGEEQLALVDGKLRVTPLEARLPKRSIHGAGFAADGALLVDAFGKALELLRLDPAKGKPEVLHDVSAPLVGIFDVREDRVLSTHGRALVLGEREVVELGQGRCFWADETGTDLVQAPGDATLIHRTFEGKTKQKLKWRRGQVPDAFGRGGLFVVSNGRWVDLLPLGKAKR